MAYTISIRYQTGNSFGTEDEVHELDKTWDNIHVVRENLCRIRDHYNFINRMNEVNFGYYGKPEDNKERIAELNKVKNEPWFIIGKRYGCDNWSSDLLIKNDDGSEEKLYAFWTGYFERLYGADIITRSVSDSDIMSFDI